jgi:hypothetical protein
LASFDTDTSVGASFDTSVAFAEESLRAATFARASNAQSASAANEEGVDLSAGEAGEAGEVGVPTRDGMLAVVACCVLHVERRGSSVKRQGSIFDRKGMIVTEMYPVQSSVKLTRCHPLNHQRTTHPLIQSSGPSRTKSCETKVATRVIVTAEVVRQ